MMELHQGDALEVLERLPSESVQTCVTSPPYWNLRDYGIEGQLGLESTPHEFVEKMVEIFREVRRVLAADGTLWLNIGDTYSQAGNGGSREIDLAPRLATRSGLAPKNLCGIPWRVALALQSDGWYLRSDIIWAKPNPMPESVIDRPARAHEYIFLLSKSAEYYYDAEALKEPALMQGQSQKKSQRLKKPSGWKPDTGVYNPLLGRYDHSDRHSGHGPKWEGLRTEEPYSGLRNKRDVWTFATQAFPEAHFATFPEELPKLCILAGSRPGDAVLDPFAGAGTTLKVAMELGRSAVGIELNPTYCAIIERRCQVTIGLGI
jgi:DNA modification methylase